MPKSAKRKADRKADFQKTKLKLGKKQQPNNATDTSFKSRTIALPQQSINIDKSQSLTNSRNLGINELVPQLRHYGAGVRKADAVLGLRELFFLHPFLIPTTVGQAIPDVARLIGDDDAGVRKALIAFLAWYLPQVPTSSLAPYYSTLLLFTTSALSHIFPEVRLDAVKVLDLILDAAPRFSTEGWERAVLRKAPASGRESSSHGERVLLSYLNLFGISSSPGSNSASTFGAASTASTDLSASAKLMLLRSIKTFLHAGAGSDVLLSNESQRSAKGQQQPAKVACPTWFFRPSFSSPADFESFVRFLRPDLRKGKSRLFDPLVMEGDFHSADLAPHSLIDVQNTAGRVLESADLHSALLRASQGLQSDERDHAGWQAASSSSSADPFLDPSLCLFSLLQPVLLATFLDSAPSAFRPGLDGASSAPSSSGQGQVLNTHAELVCSLAQLTLTLWRGAVIRAGGVISPTRIQRNELQSLLGHMAPYFPFGNAGDAALGITGSLSARAETQLRELDLAYCELTALLAMNSEGSSEVGGGGKMNGKGKRLSTSLGVQLEHVSKYISGSLKGEIGSQGFHGREPLDPETYSSLLPTVWLLLNNQTAQGSGKGSESTTRASQAELLDGLLHHFSQTSSTARVKALAFEFIARLCVVSWKEKRSCDLLVTGAKGGSVDGG
ncbi:hypothetical protein IE53DRAFT_340251 [Violaceomyces palustris]|uniref:Uncharacterized protein n=1 Tax=Violaceomyces palustris TaxID=1673888 RepID=A0ACD0P3H0_9BASI|nr:hypothetical protein IE53DRAFT_340251 [Violaceomyces palustris]